MKKSWFRDMLATEACLRRSGISSNLKGRKGAYKDTGDLRVANNKFEFGK